MSLTFLARLAHQLCVQENIPQNEILISVLHHVTLQHTKDIQICFTVLFISCDSLSRAITA